MNTPREKNSKTKVIVVWTLGIFILIPGMIGFGDKLFQFFQVLRSDEHGGRFALVPILTYLLVSAGFLLVMIWGAMKGMLSDIEGPKYKMLDDEEKLDHIEKGEAA